MKLAPIANYKNYNIHSTKTVKSSSNPYFGGFKTKNLKYDSVNFGASVDNSQNNSDFVTVDDCCFGKKFLLPDKEYIDRLPIDLAFLENGFTPHEYFETYMKIVETLQKDDKEFLRKMLLAKDRDGRTMLHRVIAKADTSSLTKLIEQLKQTPKLLSELILAEDKKGVSVYQYTNSPDCKNAEKKKSAIINSLDKDTLNEVALSRFNLHSDEEIMNIKNFDDRVALFSSIKDPSKKVKIIREIETESPSGRVSATALVIARNKNGELPIHGAQSLEEITKYLQCVSYNKDTLLKMITTFDKDGNFPIERNFKMIDEKYKDKSDDYRQRVKMSLKETYANFICNTH